MDPIATIRRRPGMYVGNLGDGSALRHLLWEVVGNSVDEHLAGRCSRIEVEIGTDGSLSVEDDGRGMSLAEIDGVPLPEKALTSFHQTPTLDGHAPHEHIAGRGFGLFPVCALSARVELRIRRGRRQYGQAFARGLTVSKLQDEGPCATTGTRIVFAPDPEIFPAELDAAPILTRLHELAFFLPKLTIRFTDRREHILHEPRGILAYLDTLSRPPGTEGPTFTAAGTVAQIAVEAVARWDPSEWKTSIESFANIRRTTAGGTHTRGLILGLVAGLREAAPEACAGQSLRTLEKAVTGGLSAVVCVHLTDLKYDSPTTERLITPAAKFAVRKCVASAFCAFLGKHPTILNQIVS